MGIEYRNTKFVNLFGDPDRPIYGDEVVVPASPSPTPSVTPTPTPSVTPTSTPAPTPSLTPSPTPPFDPSTISGLSAWYDFSNSSYVSLSGNEILTAYDRSGNGLDINAPNSSQRPILTADTISNNVGQKSAVFSRANGEYLFTQSLGITFTSGYTWFMTFKFDPTGVSTERSMMYLYGITNNQTKATNYYNYGGSDFIRTQYPGAEFDNYTTWSKFPRGLAWSQIGYPNTPYGQFDAELNDVAYTSAISDVFNMVDIDYLYLPGPFTGGAGTGTDIVFGELLIYDRLLNSSDITKVEDYLKNKWNYTSW